MTSHDTKHHSASDSTPAPAQTQTEPGATRRLLVVIDETELGQRVAAIGVAAAVRYGCAITFHLPVPVEHVEAESAAELERSLGEHVVRCKARVQPFFDAALMLAGQAGIQASTLLTIDEDPGTAIQRLAEEEGSDLIVIGSRGRGAVARAMMGSLTDELLKHCARPVLVCRDDMDHGLAALAARPSDPALPDDQGIPATAPSRAVPDSPVD